MLHSIIKTNEFGNNIEIVVSKNKETNEVIVSLFELQEGKLNRDLGITLSKEEFYDFIGTMLYVQSTLNSK